MTRPLSDAQTTFMPELHPRTTLLPRADEKCEWCKIRLCAIPEHPRPYFRPADGKLVHCHPGCIGAQRSKDSGVSVVLP